MNEIITRRDFLHTGLAGSTGAILVWPGLNSTGLAADATQGVCVTLCNHWSYIGIGWQLGIESCVLSVTDAMEMADRPPHVEDLHQPGRPGLRVHGREVPRGRRRGSRNTWRPAKWN